MLKKSNKVKMQKKDAMGELPEGMVDGGMSKRGTGAAIRGTTFKGVF